MNVVVFHLGADWQDDQRVVPLGSEGYSMKTFKVMHITWLTRVFLGDRTIVTVVFMGFETITLLQRSPPVPKSP